MRALILLPMKPWKICPGSTFFRMQVSFSWDPLYLPSHRRRCFDLLKIYSSFFNPILIFRSWPSCATGMWDSFWGSWSNLCLPITSGPNEVHKLHPLLLPSTSNRKLFCMGQGDSLSPYFCHANPNLIPENFLLLAVLLWLLLTRWSFFSVRMQAQRMNADAAYSRMSDVFRRTFQHEGLRGFYKGLFPNLLKVVPSASITYLVYETMKKRLDLD